MEYGDVQSLLWRGTETGGEFANSEAPASFARVFANATGKAATEDERSMLEMAHAAHAGGMDRIKGRHAVGSVEEASPRARLYGGSARDQKSRVSAFAGSGGSDAASNFGPALGFPADRRGAAEDLRWTPRRISRQCPLHRLLPRMGLAVAAARKAGREAVACNALVVHMNTVRDMTLGNIQNPTP